MEGASDRMRRRTLLLRTGAGLTVALAGCIEGDSGEDEPGDEPAEDENETQEEQADVEEEGGQDLDEETLAERAEELAREARNELPEDAQGTDGEVEVRIDFEGQWTGAYSTGEETDSASAERSDAFEVEGEPVVVAAAVQNQEDADDDQEGVDSELLVRIHDDEEIAAEAEAPDRHDVAEAQASFHEE